MKALLAHRIAIAILTALLLVAIAVIHSQQTAQTQRVPQFENEDVKVWEICRSAEPAADDAPP